MYITAAWYMYANDDDDATKMLVMTGGDIYSQGD